ncbi:MAG: DGQHR domain-containing protein DpdB [Halarcobacter sp.]
MLKFPALKINQHGKEIYTFKTLGKDILSFASIDRIKRDEEGNLKGYQRIKVQKHIKEIANYLADEKSILANSIVICFDTHVKFESFDGNNDFGYLCIPKDKIYGQIVDGQQRSTALDSLQNDSFEVVINAFITDNTDEQREQFLLINNTKPLPKPLIYELLPEVNSELPSTYRDKKLPNKLVAILNNQPHSPFYHAIKTHTYPEGYLKDNTIIKTLTTSLTDGILYELSEHELGMNDIESMTNIINAFWGAVEKTFPKDWKLNPKKTRLTHGAGILALANIMEEILYKKILRKNETYLEEKSFLPSDFEIYLEPLKGKIDWQNGKYDFGDENIRSIMDIQNTSKDIGLFKNFLSQQL